MRMSKWMKPEPDADPIKRILTDNPEIDSVRIDKENHRLDIGFAEELPPEPELSKIDASVCRELPNPESAMHSPDLVHHETSSRLDHQHFGAAVIEFHRTDRSRPKRTVWHVLKLPRWQNRPPAKAFAPNHRKALALAGICGASAAAGYLAASHHLDPWYSGLAYLAAYVSGGWYATREVFQELRKGRIDVHFLMIVVAIGALLVSAQTEGAILLFLFSLSGGLEQFAHYRTQKSIGSLLKDAPKRAIRRGRHADSSRQLASERADRN